MVYCLVGNSKNLESIMQEFLAFFPKDKTLDVVVVVATVVVRNCENAENEKAAAEATKAYHTIIHSHSNRSPNCDSQLNGIFQD